MTLASIQSFMWIAAVGTVLALLAALLFCRVSNTSLRAILLLLGIVFMAPAVWLFVAFHPELGDARFRAYKGFYRDIQIGMTRKEVLAAMNRRYPVNDSRGKPKLWQDDPSTMNFFMNSEQSREPNCEGIFLGVVLGQRLFLGLKDGRVVSKEYSPD